jgi:hypothetical protein
VCLEGKQTQACNSDIVREKAQACNSDIVREKAQACNSDIVREKGTGLQLRHCKRKGTGLQLRYCKRKGTGLQLRHCKQEWCAMPHDRMRQHTLSNIDTIHTTPAPTNPRPLLPPTPSSPLLQLLEKLKKEAAAVSDPSITAAATHTAQHACPYPAVLDCLNIQTRNTPHSMYTVLH